MHMSKAMEKGKDSCMSGHFCLLNGDEPVQTVSAGVTIGRDVATSGGSIESSDEVRDQKNTRNIRSCHEANRVCHILRSRETLATWLATLKICNTEARRSSTQVAEMIAVQLDAICLKLLETAPPPFFFVPSDTLDTFASVIFGQTWPVCPHTF